MKSFLDRLIEKRFVRVDKSAFAHLFFAKTTRQEFVGRQLQRLAECHFGGSLALLAIIKTICRHNLSPVFETPRFDRPTNLMLRARMDFTVS